MKIEDVTPKTHHVLVAKTETDRDRLEAQGYTCLGYFMACRRDDKEREVEDD